MRIQIALLWMVAVCLAVSCSGRYPIHPDLVTADAIMESAPDSTLVILQSIDQSKFTKCDSDFFSLIMPQAQVKNNIVLNSDSLIGRALNAYKNSPDKNLELRARFYYARVALYAGNLQEAMEQAAEAYDISREYADVLWQARTSELIADIFGESYNYPQAEKYEREAIILYKEADKVLNHRYALCNLATYLINQGDNSSAIVLMDSLRRIIANEHPVDSTLLSYLIETEVPAFIYTDQYERVVADFPEFVNADFDFDPSGRELLNSYLFSHLDDKSRMEESLARAVDMANQDSDSIRVLYARYRLALDDEKYEEAALLSDTLMYFQAKMAEQQINESVTVMLAEHYDIQRVRHKIQSEKLKAILLLLLLVVTCGTIIITLIIVHRKKIHAMRIEVLMSEILRLTVETSSANILIESYFREQWKQLNSICVDYFDFGNSELMKRELLNKAEAELRRMQEPQQLQCLVEAADRYLGSALTKLHRECTFLKNDDMILLAMMGAELSVKTISLILGLKYKTVYQRRARLVKKIEESGVSPELFFWRNKR